MKTRIRLLLNILPSSPMMFFHSYYRPRSKILSCEVYASLHILSLSRWTFAGTVLFSFSTFAGTFLSQCLGVLLPSVDQGRCVKSIGSTVAPISCLKTGTKPNKHYSAVLKAVKNALKYHCMVFCLLVLSHSLQQQHEKGFGLIDEMYFEVTLRCL